MNPKGKVAIVTGGASGLGLACVEELLDAGARVAIFDSNRRRAEEHVQRLGAESCAAVVNVTDEQSVAKGIESVIERWQAIHINVNCAGIAMASRVLGAAAVMPLAAYEKVIRVNLTGTFNVVRLCAAAMRRNVAALGGDSECGVIINTASTSAFDGQIGQAAYSASKGGLISMTLPLAREFAEYGIRVMSIAPGIFDTALLDAAPPGLRTTLLDAVQFPKRLGEPQEFAKTVRHVIECTYLNGATLRLDAGMRAQPR